MTGFESDALILALLLAAAPAAAATRYVWQFLGQRIPETIYGGAMLFGDGFE